MLSNKQKKYLSSLAQGIKPVVMIGAHGLTEGVLAEIEYSIDHHELIKVKITGADKATKKLISNAICREINSQEVQIIGNMLILFKPKRNSAYRLPQN